jgi:predicted negative regulator of RcsB-dependent stress response
MSSLKKEKIKALKGPDEFQARVLRVLDWANKNVKYLTLIAVPVALALIGLFVWKNVSESFRDKRLSELGQAQVVYDDEEKAAEKQRETFRGQIEKIDADMAKPAAPVAGQPPPPATPADPALAAKKDALQKQVDAVKADHSASLKLFQAYFDKFAGKPEGWLAGMTAAKIQAEQNSYGDARSTLEKVLERADSDKFYQVQARFMLVGLLEEQGEYDAAIAEVDKLDSLVEPDATPRVLLA